MIFIFGEKMSLEGVTSCRGPFFVHNSYLCRKDVERGIAKLKQLSKEFPKSMSRLGHCNLQSCDSALRLVTKKETSQCILVALISRGPLLWIMMQTLLDTY